MGTDENVCAVTSAISVTAGTKVTYCYYMVNTGALTLSVHTVVDSELGDLLHNFPVPIGPGNSAWFTTSASISNSTVNTATWMSFNPGPANTVTATTTATVTVLTPEISLVKTVGTNPSACASTSAITVTAGTKVTYCYHAVNTGPVTVTRHTLADDKLGLILDSVPYAVGPGSSAYVTQSAVITTTTINSATWTSFDPGPVNVAEDSDTALVTVLRRVWLPLVRR